VAGIWDGPPGANGLWGYLGKYPRRLQEQLLSGMGAFAEDRQPIHLLGALNPAGPLIEDAAVQAGGLLAPQVNALSQSLSQGSENLGLGPLSIPEVTDEQLAPLLMLGMGGRGGMGGRNKMGFYSPSGKALTTAPGKGQSGQYLAHLKKEPGATREAKETGLLQALEEAPGTLTKEEVVSMWNPIELDETVKADDSYRAGLLAEVMDKRQATGVRLRDRVMELTGLSLPQSVMQHSVSDWEQELRSYTIFAENLPGDPQIMGLLSDLGRYDDQSENLASVAKTKYGNSQDLNLPGGSNAKEILVQLPRKPTTELPEGYRITKLDGHPRHKFTLEGPTGVGNPIAGNSFEEAHENALRAYFSWTDKSEIYTEGHWDEPNVLAHIRTNERDVGGVKALHIEEIQSDWHQQGQKKGYQNNAAVAEFEAYSKELAEKYDLNPQHNLAMYATSKNMSPDEVVKYNQLQNEVFDDEGDTGVPDAPYKKDWHELAFKRALMEGINDPSIERLTWTTGDVQADRYSLAKYINSIEAQAVGDNFNLAVTHKDGHAQNLQNVTPDELSDHVGKEMAEKIVREKGGMYSGLDLEVGGEFHKQLYDKKITKFAKKFLKKYGVEPKKWQAPSHTTSSATAKDGTLYYIGGKADGDDIWHIYKEMPDNSEGKWVDDVLMETPGNMDAAREALRKYGDLDDSPYDIWSIDITPEMRQDLQEKGVPLAMNKRKRRIGQGLLA
jgi:hypothetical protein